MQTNLKYTLYGDISRYMQNMHKTCICIESGSSRSMLELNQMKKTSIYKLTRLHIMYHNLAE